MRASSSREHPAVDVLDGDDGAGSGQTPANAPALAGRKRRAEAAPAANVNVARHQHFLAALKAVVRVGKQRKQQAAKKARKSSSSSADAPARSKAELQYLCYDQGLKYSGMNKAQLAAALDDPESAAKRITYASSIKNASVRLALCEKAFGKDHARTASALRAHQVAVHNARPDPGTRLPAGEYYVGDLCYVKSLDWTAFGEATDWFCKRSDDLTAGFFRYAGTTFFASNTAFGDGFYGDSEGGSYSVDAGIIGCYPMSALPDDPELNGCYQIVAFEDDFTCALRDDGGTITIGHLKIETGSIDDDY